MSAKLRENATLGTKGAKRRIRLISEGQGSSGYYSGSLLERDGAAAFPKGTHIYLDHLTDSQYEDRQGSHSILDLVGVTISDAVFEEGALNADANFFSNFSSLVEEMREHIDLSIEAAGEVKEGVVESLHPSPLNAVSIVPHGGRDGKILDLIESYRESGKIDNVKPDADKVREDARKDKGMTPEEIDQIAEKLATALAPSFASLKEALTPVVPDAGDTEAADAVEVAEALVEAFPTSKASRTRVAEAVKNGAKVADAIEAEKTLVESVKADLPVVNEDDSVLRESASKTPNYSVGGWAR
jgi:hypothetical protein